MAAVDLEVFTQLVRRQPASAPPLAARVLSASTARVATSSRSRSSAVSEASVAYGDSSGAPQDVVGVAAPDPGDRALIAQQRVHAPSVVARRGSARRTRRSRARVRDPSSGPSSPAASTHHAALRSVPNSRSSNAGPSAIRMRTTAPRGFVRLGGSSMSRRPACDRWIIKRPAAPNSTIKYLRPPGHPFDRPARRACPDPAPRS